jgi:hypothetical protein
VYYDPADYGPIGLGDDTDALQGALLACGTSPVGGVVGIEAGTYRITRDLLLKGKNTRIEGEGYCNTVLNYRGTGGYCLQFGRPEMDRTVPALASNWDGLSLADFCIDGVGSTNAKGAIKVWGATRYACDRLWLRSFNNSVGVHHLSGWVGSWNDCRLQDCRTGYWFQHPGPSGSQSWNAVAIHKGEIQAGRIGILVGVESSPVVYTNPIGAGLAVRDTTIEGQSLWGVYLTDGLDILLDHVYFESTGRVSEGGPLGAIRLGNSNAVQLLYRGTVRDCSMLGAMGGGTANACCVYVDRTWNCKVDGNDFNPSTNALGQCGLRATAQAQGLQVGPNRLAAAVLNAPSVPYDLANCPDYVLLRNDEAGQGMVERSARPHKFVSANFSPVLTDTSGKTLAQLEAEVNLVKGACRTFGVAR